MADILGLLPGCELARIGMCEPDEFEQMDNYLLKGARGCSQVVVKPAPGYEFQYEIVINAYRPVKMLPTKRIVVARFAVTNEAQMDALQGLTKHPTFLSLTEEEAPADAAAEAGGA